MENEHTYQSPFSWRYGSSEMREIWSEYQTRLLWRKLWISLAEVQVDFQLVTEEQLKELQSHEADVDLERSMEIEEQIQHDLMAELQAFADQCPSAGGIIHMGATSMDIKDNALVMQMSAAQKLAISRLKELLLTLSNLINSWSDLPLIGFTHLQPAEPTTLGYRLSQYAQDLLTSYQDLISLDKRIKSKGFTGAVGTSASYSILVGEKNLDKFQEKLSEKIGLSFFAVSTQTYPRIQDFQILSALAGVGAALNKLAFDLRVLQSPGLGEIAEPFGEKQIGSSTMPFKQNPINAEKINSLARYLAQLPRIAWDNAAYSLLERTMDDSANRRVILPQAFLALDEMMIVCNKILSGLQVFENRISQNMDTYGPFAATEQLLMLLSKAGADRQEMHEILRKHTLVAWSEVRQGNQNPIIDLVSGDQKLLEYLSTEEISRSFTETAYLGDAVQRAKRLSATIVKTISD